MHFSFFISSLFSFALCLFEQFCKCEQLKNYEYFYFYFKTYSKNKNNNKWIINK